MSLIDLSAKNIYLRDKTKHLSDLSILRLLLTWFSFKLRYLTLSGIFEVN